MRSEPRQKLRLLIQFVKSEPHYVLLAYGNGDSMIPSRFDSLEQIGTRFEEAGIPVERQPNLVQERPNAPEILYADDFFLNEAQLKILGLRPRK